MGIVHFSFMLIVMLFILALISQCNSIKFKKRNLIDIERLIQQNADLSSQLIFLREEVMQLNDELKNLTRENITLTKEVYSLMQEVTHLQNQMVTYK